MRMSTPVSLPSTDALQLWQLSTPLPELALSRVRTWLSEHEKQRVRSYAHEHHARQFEARRGLLRLVLAHALGCQPREVQLVSNPQGKPLLCTNQHAACDIHFNLSHSHDMAILAVTRHGPVGVDVERINPSRDVMGIAKRFFHPDEYEHLAGLEAHARAASFYDLWACKEAIIKAQGQGIASSISRWRIAGCSDSPGVRRCVDHQDARANWSLRSFRLESACKTHFAAAIALPGDRASLETLPDMRDSQSLL